MDKDICRAITYINYHIPPVLPDGQAKLPYITLGFFDGMITERLEVCYGDYELKDLWRYTIRWANGQLGQCSYQNIFCFSRDSWNQCTDEIFWSEEINWEYPLTFVVFLQLREYRAGESGIRQQCEAFNKVANEIMEGIGLCYTYNTIDKNDFVVCIKCKKYKTVVDVIKNLHKTKAEVVYSYSVFSISRETLFRLQDERYQYLFEEDICSICFKGIANSYDLQDTFTLDQKYRDFCMKLMTKLYDGQDVVDQDYRIYDILGDDDFRLIARHVRLGKLLQQFVPGELLSYEGDSFQFTFFSSDMVLNIQTPEDFDEIDDEQIKNSKKKRLMEFCSPRCDRLEHTMINIYRIVSQPGQCVNEKVITFCHALWQLLQSLKPLETAPTKQYDFWSLYLPFSLLATILEDKLGKICVGQADEQERGFTDNEEIYNFIHKISTTLHGTLRTDIQFFQIRDFNVIVHYAPAKLRAFYSFWVLRLTDYYNEFNTDGVKNEYSFILSPGMYQKIGVSELYTNYAECRRLMLIKVPERHLYAVRWFPVILAHEVSHFVGYASRQRYNRHIACLKACARILFLEVNSYRYHTSKGEWQPVIEQRSKELKMYEEMVKRLVEEEQCVRIESKLYPHEFHSKNSCRIIEKTFRRVNERYTDKAIAEDLARINIFLKNEENVKEMSINQQCRIIKDIRDYTNNMHKELLLLYQKFESDLLSQLLNILIYVCKETYADLIAILTLGLSPSEYISSFTKGGCDIESDRLQEEETILLPVRVGYVMQTVINAVQSRGACFAEAFCEKWPADALEKTIVGFSMKSLEINVALDTYGYITGKRNCNEKISGYKALYNYEEGCFVNRVLDFFNDSMVWKSLMGYLEESVDAYITIFSKRHLKEMRQKLLSTYNKVARGDIMSMSQEIEIFLEEFEREKSCSNILV